MIDSRAPAQRTSLLPLWLKISYTLMVLVIIPVYWVELGPGNLLWFSDIALMALVLALWLENRLINSTMAVGVLFLEIGWVLDFLTGGNVIQIAAYMYEEDTDTHIRILSGAFHLALPPVILFLLVRLGYDQRAFWVQVALAAAVLPATYLLTDPADNINWVFGPADEQQLVPPLAYLALLMAVLTLAVYLPSHLLFRRLFRGRA